VSGRGKGKYYNRTRRKISEHTVTGCRATYMKRKQHEKKDNQKRVPRNEAVSWVRQKGGVQNKNCCRDKSGTAQQRDLNERPLGRVALDNSYPGAWRTGRVVYQLEKKKANRATSRTQKGRMEARQKRA